MTLKFVRELVRPKLFYNSLSVNFQDRCRVLIAVFFPSYSFPNKPQPLWEHISKQKPDLWVWLGDGMFANTSNDVIIYTIN